MQVDDNAAFNYASPSTIAAANGENLYGELGPYEEESMRKDMVGVENGENVDNPGRTYDMAGESEAEYSLASPGAMNDFNTPPNSGIYNEKKGGFTLQPKHATL